LRLTILPFGSANSPNLNKWCTKKNYLLF
jgi:hypothetical protein